MPDVLDRHAQRVRSLLPSLDRHVEPYGEHAAPGDQPIAATVHERRPLNRARQTERAPPAVVIGLENTPCEQLDRFGAHARIVVLSAPERPSAETRRPPSGLEFLCALRDPSNAGALIRSAAAFAVTRLVLLKESASPLHPRAVRAASAATLSVALPKGPSIQDLPALPRSGGTIIIALDVGGHPITSMNWPRDARLLTGEEGRGDPIKDAFQPVCIPMAGSVESLNAGVAAGIALYAYRAQHPLCVTAQPKASGGRSP